MKTGNLFADLPESLPDDLLEELLSGRSFRLERIVSTGQATPPDEWYDQEQPEWVVLLAGSAALRFDGETKDRLVKPGDWLYIPAHRKHRVQWTDAQRTTVWLALHYDFEPT